MRMYVCMYACMCSPHPYILLGIHLNVLEHFETKECKTELLDVCDNNGCCEGLFYKTTELIRKGLDVFFNTMIHFLLTAYFGLLHS